MTIRRALFLGGAVLVLSACSDTTAPTATAKRGGTMAATTQKLGPQGPTITTMSTTSTSTTSECRSGYTVTSGRDSTATSDSTSSCY